MKSVSRVARLVAASLVLAAVLASPVFAGVNGRPQSPRSSNPFVRFLQSLFKPRVLDDLAIPRP